MAKVRGELSQLEEANSRLKSEHEVMSDDYERLREDHRVLSNEFHTRLQTIQIEWTERANASQAQVEHLQEDMVRKLEDFELAKSTMRSEYERRINELENRVSELSRELAAQQDQKRTYYDQCESLRAELGGFRGALAESRAQAEMTVLDLTAEIRVLQAQVESARASEYTLADEKARLVAQIDAYHRKLGEIEARFCEAINEKERLFKEIVELNKRQAERAESSEQNFEFKLKIEEKLEQMQTRFEKTKRMSGHFRTSFGGDRSLLISNDMNESLVARRFDSQFETILQNKVSWFSSFFKFSS